MTYKLYTSFLETTAFTRRIKELISDDEYRALQLALGIEPDQGSVIRGTKGLRKIRWGRKGWGKRGGIRIIYYWHKATDRVYMLLAYDKRERDDLTAEQRRILSRLVEEEFR